MHQFRTTCVSIGSLATASDHLQKLHIVLIKLSVQLFQVYSIQIYHTKNSVFPCVFDILNIERLLGIQKEEKILLEAENLVQ